MFPYFMNQTPYGGMGSMNMNVVPNLAEPVENLADLPEEVRQAIESHRDEFHTAADLRSFIAGELKRR